MKSIDWDAVIRASGITTKTEKDGSVKVYGRDGKIRYTIKDDGRDTLLIHPPGGEYKHTRKCNRKMTPELVASQIRSSAMFALTEEHERLSRGESRRGIA